MQPAYQVIARRWRPQSFEEVVGQEAVVRTLKNAIQQNRIAHAYLFVGPRGTGKTTLARILAKALNCENGPSIAPSLESPICQAIMKGSCIDVIEIDGASNNSVDQVRELREACQYSPALCRYKIYIIDEVHMLSTAAFNALLKVLEEPPAHVKFIFATTDIEKVLPTIVSRCQRFELKPLSSDLIEKHLSYISDIEKWNVEAGVLSLVARMAQGGMRDAQSIFEQLVAFCGEKITLNDVLSIYGLCSPNTLEALTNAIATANYSAIIDLSKKIAADGKDFSRTLSDLLYHFSQLLSDKAAGKKLKTPEIEALTLENLMLIVESLQKGKEKMPKSLSEELEFQMALLLTARNSQVKAIDTLIQKIRQLQTDGDTPIEKKKP